MPGERGLMGLLLHNLELVDIFGYLRPLEADVGLGHAIIMPEENEHSWMQLQELLRWRSVTDTQPKRSTLQRRAPLELEARAPSRGLLCVQF